MITNSLGMTQQPGDGIVLPSGGSGGGTTQPPSGDQNQQSGLITASQLYGTAPASVVFTMNGTLPQNPLQSHLRFRWAFGDGTTQDVPYGQMSVTHVYNSPGSYKVGVLLISDGSITLSPLPQPVYMNQNVVITDAAQQGGGSQNENNGGDGGSSTNSQQQQQDTTSQASLFSNPLLLILLAGGAIGLLYTMKKGRKV